MFDIIGLMKISKGLNDQLINSISQLRIRNGFSQEYVAKKLNISRSSYINLEKKYRSITISQLDKIADLYDTSIRSLINGDEKTDVQKFTQIYFRILRNYPEGIPKTKLAKLLYLIDFNYFYKNHISMSKTTYIHRRFGPVAEIFFELTDTLFEIGKIKIALLSEGAFLISCASKNTHCQLLDSEETDLIDEISLAWKNHSTQEIVNYTHEQKPWMSTKDGDAIPYELILEEDDDHLYLPVSG